MKVHYFNGKLSAGFVSLFTGRMLQFAGNGFIGLFFPVYLYIHFQMNIIFVFGWYLIGHVVYILVVPWGAQFFNRFGMRRSLRISVLFDALYLSSAFLIPYNTLLFAFLSFFFLIFARLFFWLPFHVDFAKFTDRGDRGKEVSIIWAVKSLLGIILPIASGFLILYFDFTIVFILGITLYLAAIIPFMALPHTREKFEWSYVQTVKNFFKKKNRNLVWSNMANGAENGVAIVMWPIFIWQLLNGNYAAVGLLSSVIVLIGVVLQLFVGKYTDLFNKRKLLHWGSIFYAFGWLAKVFVLTGFHVFVVGAYHQFAQIFKDTPFDTLNYELLADRGHYVDEYTVLKELAVHLGRALMYIFAIAVALSFGLNWTFAIAAIASLLINFL